MSVIGDRLKHARERKNLTQIQVMNHTVINNKTLSGWEKGTNEPDAATIKFLGGFYEVNPAWIAGYTDSLIPSKEQFTNDIAQKISLAALKEWKNRIAAGEAEDIPTERIPHIVDALDKEIMMIEAQLKEQK